MTEENTIDWLFWISKESSEGLKHGSDIMERQKQAEL